MPKALIFDCYDDYTIRIQYIKQAFLRAGYDVEIFFSDYDHYQKKYVEKKRDGVQYIHAQEYKKNLSYARIHSHQLFAKACVQKASEYNDVSLIYVMVPPNSMCKEFALYHRDHPNMKLMFDLCDMWPESLPLSNTLKTLAAPVLNVWRDIRNNYIGEADCVLGECNLFTNEIRNAVDQKKLHTLYLCQTSHFVEYQGDEDCISVLYCGSINNIIHIELIHSLLQNIHRMKKVVLHVIGNGESKEEFIQTIQQDGITVIDHGVVYEEDRKQEIYAQCQYGLNLMKDSVFVGLTMKSLDYLSHGLPILSNIKGDTWNLVDQEHIGLNICDNSVKDVSDVIVNMKQDDYDKYRKQVMHAFVTYFDESVIEKQIDKIMEEI